MQLQRMLAIGLSAVLIAPGAELNVRNVILYKHGVGYFERAGELSPGESARLDFKADEMNDVLKSLTMGVKGGAGVAGLRYDSSLPFEQKIDEIPIRLGDKQPISTLLDQLKGARLELKLGAETVAGSIVSARVVPGGRDQGEREQVTLLLDSGELRTLDLSAASSIRFPDPKLQLQLKDYLMAVTQARSKEKRSVYIDSVDSARREIVASYMIPTPVWKSSYRLVFTPAGEPTLEGWAIVDNTTGDDWTNVRLALVSGRPISFISQLYEPKYVERAVADLPEEHAVAPVVHQGGVIGGIVGGVPGGVPAPPPPAAKAATGEFLRSRAPQTAAAEAMQLRDQVVSTAAVATQGRELGDLFEYSFDKPVTVKKNESAMLPFLQQKLTARKLLIYTANGNAQHPMNAAELTNSTGKTLDGGPITVFDSNAYAGEALMETTKSNDKRLISYGIDIGTRITTKIDSEAQNYREVSMRRGVLTTKSARLETRVYSARNVDAKPKTLIVEHPLRQGYKLLNQKPTETTANAYRFEVKLAPSATEQFKVSEEYIFDQTFGVSNLTPDFLVTLIQNRQITPQARQALQLILDKKREIAATDRAVSETQRSIDELAQDQQRIRENLSSLNRVAGQQEQVQKYARQLSDQEAALAGLRDKQGQLRKQKTALESELSAIIEKTEF
jgi:hypothetical protein